MSAEEAESKIGLKPRLGGLWHEGAGIVAVAEWVRARLNRSGASLLLNTRVGTLSKQGKSGRQKTHSGKSLLKRMRWSFAAQLIPLIFYPESNFR